MVKLSSLALLSAALFLPLTAWAQQMDYLSLQRIEAAVAGLTDPLLTDPLEAKAGAVMAGLGLTWGAPVVPDIALQPFVADAGAVIELVDIRLLLTQIAIQAGARDHDALIRAQGARDHDVILLRDGFVTLKDLWTLSQGTPAQKFVTLTPEGIVLTRPLAIWADAGLSLADQDKLILDRPSGSFLANLGWLNLSGGSISGAGGPNRAEAAFRPFVLTAGQGSLTARAATFQALGFGKATVFGGIAVVNHGLGVPSRASVIAQSTLTDVATLGLIATTGAVVSGNRMETGTGQTTGTALLISQAKKTVVSGNRLIARSGAQSIRISAGAMGVRISDNLISGASRMGILIDQGSQAVGIVGNVVAGNLTSGISVDAATCVRITDNLVAGNGGVGLNLSSTEGLIAANNAILFNKGSGILVRNQTPTAAVHLTGNILIGNREGVRGATPGHVVLEGNDFDGQMPRVFAGDMAPLTVDWLRNRHQRVPVSGSAAMPAPCEIPGGG